MNNTVTHLFVYGSLRSGFRNPAYSYLSKYFTLVGQGFVKGKLYDTGNYPVAVSTTDNHFLVGELYAINSPIEFEWAISQLDDYEGIATEGDEQPLYKRDITTVTCNHEQTSAWVYWYNADISAMPIIASGDLMEYMNKKN